jgi:hypothetical protein
VGYVVVVQKPNDFLRARTQGNVGLKEVLNTSFVWAPILEKSEATDYDGNQSEGTQ